MVRIGLAGIGFMGMIHYLAAKRLTGATVTANKSGIFTFSNVPTAFIRLRCVSKLRMNSVS